MDAVQSYDVRSVDRAEVLRYLGYAGQPLSAELDARIDAGMARCLEVARPRGCVRVFDVAGRGERDGAPVIRSRDAPSSCPAARLPSTWTAPWPWVCSP